MITDYLNKKTIRLKVEAHDREEAIREAAACLVEDKKIKQEYVEQMIDALHKFGPYIVVIPRHRSGSRRGGRNGTGRMYEHDHPERAGCFRA